MEEVCGRENCQQALRRVKANKGSPGIDGMRVEELPGYLKQHWPAIREQLLSGTYQPQPVRRVEIAKPDGGVRKLGIPTVLDSAGGDAGSATQVGPACPAVWQGRAGDRPPYADFAGTSFSHVPRKLRYTPQHMAEKTTTTATSSTNERRSRQRVPVRVPVKVRHEGSEHQGLTRDLSSSGVFIYSESGMKAGSKLELVIMLPPGMGLGPGGWTLCEASVVRVEESDGKGIGVAATLDRIALLPEII